MNYMDLNLIFPIPKISIWKMYVTSLKNRLPILLNMDENAFARNIGSRNQILIHTLNHLIYDKGNTADCGEKNVIFNKYY